MPKVLPEYLELRKQQLLNAAAACFARRGFHQTTMQDICDEASLSPGAVYRYFRSKEEMIEAMCVRGHSEDSASIAKAMAQPDTLAIIDELLRVFFSETEDSELCALSVELVSEARHNDFIRDSLRRSWDQVRTPLAAIIGRAQARGEIAPELDPQSVARVMMALHSGLVQQRLAEPDTDVVAYTAAVRSLLHGAFWRGSERPA